MEQGSAPTRPSIVDRAKAIILTPKEEWPKIAAEPATQADILKSYVLPLAAIGPIASLIGGQIFGYGAFGFSYRPGIVSAISTAILTYVLSIVAVYVLMFIADFLAPKFNGESNPLNAFKLVAYSYTASWVAGIFGLIPALAFFGLLGIYSLYLLYTGVTPLMKVPQDKAGGYTAVTVLCAIVLYFVVGAVTVAITRPFAGAGLAAASAGDAAGSVTVPGVGTIDLEKAQDAAQQMEDAANGKSPPVPSASMQALLPMAIGSYQRTATESVAVGQMGSTAEGTYTAGDKSYKLKVVDMSALGALAGLGAAMGVEQSREDADGYERTTTVDGQMQTEAWNRTGNSGKYGVVVNNRFLIEAEGAANSIEDLRQAVRAVDQSKLMNLAG